MKKLKKVLRAAKRVIAPTPGERIEQAILQCGAHRERVIGQLEAAARRGDFRAVGMHAHDVVSIEAEIEGMMRAVAVISPKPSDPPAPAAEEKDGAQ